MAKVIIVTGACGSLGRAVVAELAARGDHVVAVDRIADDVPGAASVEAVDLTDGAEVDGFYQRLISESRAIAGLVNVAGGFVWEPMLEGSANSWDYMYRINLKTVVSSCRVAFGRFDEAASIVNIGAAASERPGVGMAPYAASKAGVRALTESLAEELRNDKIRVNAILPTILDTPANRAAMPEVNPAMWVTPARVAKVIAFLLLDDAAAITGVSIPLSL